MYLASELGVGLIHRGLIAIAGQPRGLKAARRLGCPSLGPGLAWATAVVKSGREGAVGPGTSGESLVRRHRVVTWC